MAGEGQIHLPLPWGELMAQLGFAVAGAAVGSLFGMPQLGWIAGAAIGGLLFPSKGPSTEGPRLGDLSVSSSAYGMPIPIIYGTMRVAGNMIWSSGLREVKRTQKVGGKGGGGGSTTTYSYYASFAVAFGEGPADDVLRIWADSKLIYDKASLAAGTTKAGLKFRFHPGNETQLPDPLIEAAVGAGRAPAHRGLCTIVFEELPLADFGNRVPNINAEITYNKVDQKPWLALDPITPEEGALLTGFTFAVIGVDWARNVGYLLDHSGDSGDDVGIRPFSLITMKEDRQAPLSSVMEPSYVDLSGVRWVITCDDDGYLYLMVGAHSHGQVLVRIEPQSLREVARFGITDNWPAVSFTTTDFSFADHMVVISAYSLTGRVDFLYVASSYSAVGLLKTADMSYVWGAGQHVSGEISGMAKGQAGSGFGEGWLLATSQWTDHTYCKLYRMRVDVTAGVDPISGETVGVEHSLMISLMPGDVVAGATGFYGECCALTYDKTDNSVIFMVEIVGPPRQPYVLKWREDLGVVWATPLPYMLNWNYHAFDHARIERDRWTLVGMRWIYQVDTATGALVYAEEWPSEVYGWGDQVYDSVTDCLYTWTASDLVVKAFLGRGSGAGVPLSGIVADLCSRAGLLEADIDAGELADVVPGYVISRQTTVRGAIEPLSNAYFFDGVEIDYTLAFRDRGRASVADIPSMALVPISDEESWRERRTQEVDLPERVSVISLNRDVNYQQGAQSEKRIALPTPAMHSRNQIAVELAIAMDATTAKRIAAKMLTLAWIERSTYEYILPPPWLRLDPTDVVTVTFAGGSAYRSRTLRIDTGADFRLSVKGVSDAVAAYTSSVAADGGRGLPVQTITTSVVTFLILPDVPLLRDVDDTGGTGSRVYFAGGGYGEAGWRGAVLYRSADGASWETVGSLTEEAAYGITLNALGAPARSAFCTDNDNTLVVAMTTGGDELESVTQDVMVNGTANAALIVKANGEPEIIQFRDVSYDAGSGSYSLSGLLRGRRGTDVFTSGHTAGEVFLLLDPLTVSAGLLSLGDLDVSRQWRAVTVGSLFEDAVIMPRVHSGRDLKPYTNRH
jgi:hypothetical protein